jgi:predicted signal transduction protein with EAL and GGDEF domain
MGGDEFVVLQTHLDRPEDAEALARRLLSSIDCPFDLDGHHIVVSTSIGIAIAPRDGTTSEELLRNADMALYAAKSDGRSTFSLFEPVMDLKLKAHRQQETDLREALANSAFELYYQPQINTATEEITGCEALLRWNHPENGLVAPANFIPLAEEIGLIVPIGEWVLREACREAMTWPASFRIAVNLSPAQLRSHTLVQSVLDALHESGLEPGRLELEITETAWLHNDEATARTLHELHELGIKISMDDFGTGYASLSNLHRFPFDKIKIDRSFVENMKHHDDAAAIIKAVVWLGNELGITTVAEGVETTEQLAHVRAFGCSEVQGFLFSRPLPAAALREFIAARPAKSDAA